MQSWRMQNLNRFVQSDLKPYTNWFLKLRHEDWKHILGFIEKYDELDRDNYERTLNRYFLDYKARFGVEMPKNYAQILEILGNMNVKRGGDGESKV